MNGFRRCVSCKDARNMSSFNYKTEDEDGFCMKCRIKAAKTMFNSAKSRAHKNDLDFNLEIYDCFIPTYCPVLDIPLYKGGHRDNSPSLDRIDNTKGYIQGNVHIISMRANRIKNDSSVEELIKLVWNLSHKKILA